MPVSIRYKTVLETMDDLLLNIAAVPLGMKKDLSLVGNPTPPLPPPPLFFLLPPYCLPVTETVHLLST